MINLFNCMLNYVKMVDQYPGGDTITYQWVSNN